MTAKSEKSQSQHNRRLSIPKDALNFWADRAGPTKQSLAVGQPASNSSSLPDVGSLHITSVAQDVLPSASQKPMCSGIADSTSPNLQIATNSLDSPEKFDTVFRSLSSGDSQSELSKTEHTDQHFEQGLSAGLDLAKRLLAFCEFTAQNYTDESGTLDTLLQEAKELYAFKPKSEKCIALLGRSGEGKSSLINSLLGFGELAPTGDTGSACTSVVTEFRQQTDRHISPITLEVEYYNVMEIEELLTDLVLSFRKVQLLLKAKSVEDEEALPQDEQHAENQSNEAWSALQAAFGHHQLFGRPFLLDQSAGALDRITSQLNQWSQLLKWPAEAEGGKYAVAAADEEDCASKISLFMQDKFWPFTKIMRIFVDSDVLKSGIVLADLPGRNDTNTAKIKAGQMYLQKCDCVFVLSNISRAVTDASLKSSVYEMLVQQMPVEWEMNRGKNLHVSVICTKTDEINIAANKRALFPDNSLGFKYCVRSLEKDTKQAAEERKRKASKTMMKSLLIKARNNSVESKLRRCFHLENSTSQLDVFCVSSKMYNKWIQKTDLAENMLDLSGIPTLRMFCRSLNRSDRQAEILNFLQSRLLGLLHTIESLSNTTDSRTDPETAAELWDDTQEKIKYAVINTGDQIKERCLQSMADYFDQRADHWKSAALQESGKWQSWHNTQHNAFCQNYGDHATVKRPRTNWNRSIIWKMAQELAMPMEGAEEEAWEYIERLLEDVQREINDLKEMYEEADMPEVVFSGLDLQASQLVFVIRSTQQDLERKLVSLRRSALEANRASYVVRNMMPAYLSANREFGSGMKARQSRTVQTRIGLGLFPAMQREIEDNLSRLLDTAFGELRNQLKSIFRLIKHGIAAGLTAPEEYQQIKLHNDSFTTRVKQLLTEHQQILEQIGAAQTKVTASAATIARELQ